MSSVKAQFVVGWLLTVSRKLEAQIASKLIDSGLIQGFLEDEARLASLFPASQTAWILVFTTIV